MDNDWLNSFFEDPVLNDKMITDAVPAPRIRSEHSYSTVNNDPTSPFGLTKIEGIYQNSGPGFLLDRIFFCGFFFIGIFATVILYNNFGYLE